MWSLFYPAQIKLYLQHPVLAAMIWENVGELEQIMSIFQDRSDQMPGISGTLFTVVR